MLFTVTAAQELLQGRGKQLDLLTETGKTSTAATIDVGL